MPGLLPGALALLLIAMLFGSAVAALLRDASALDVLTLVQEPYLRRVLLFTVWQATLSTLLSVGLGLMVARALARRRFAGRQVLIRLLGLPMVTPAIVAVFGIVEVFGQQGWLSSLAQLLGWTTWPSLYGLGGHSAGACVF